MPDARDMPLFRFGAELRRRARLRRRRRIRLAGGALLIAGLAATLVWPPVPRLVWNVSSSAPTGLYLVRPGIAPVVGDMTIAWTPEPARRFAAARGYLPVNVPLVKRVAAAAGDAVCARDDGIFVNGRRVAGRRRQDGQGRPLPRWHGCTTLRASELFLLMSERAGSFDGRYFGATAVDDIVGEARPLWVR